MTKRTRVQEAMNGVQYVPKKSSRKTLGRVFDCAIEHKAFESAYMSEKRKI